ncbi:metallophosphoesterase [Streptomyces sp. TRM66268-LWL]|uniref:Metallophosphoesterase n=1 Tax=Streptomyces polyasparticus TaxID=2767826 RepID=A0ABR7SS91_9ACTN|nr:metallophosphoesterase [Streptomyces polyasparticus]MBC9717193.1 metallophosphoesterase [Streptomyces polyasparticus]
MIVLFVLAGLAALSALLGLHYYLWRRLVRDTTTAGSVARKAGTAGIVTALALMIAAFAGARAGLPFGLQQVLAWPGYLWMALFLYLTLSLLVGEAVRPLLLRWLRRRDAAEPDAVSAPAAEALAVREAVGVGGEGSGSEPEPAAQGLSGALSVGADRVEEGSAPGREGSVQAAGLAHPTRRLFVSRIIGGAAATAAVATVGYGTYSVMRGPRLKHLTVPLAKLPRGAHGFRIAVVSDIHLGPVLGRAHTQRIVDTINSAQADLVAVVGDLVDGSVEDLGHAAEPLAGLRSRHGSFFVTGNHEYFSGAQQWVDHVRELGMQPLENARVEIGGFDLAGVNDVAGESEGQGPDFVKALGDRDRSRASVLLAHQPVVIHDAVEHGVDLQLSGHTHGGQMWPGNFIADLANPTLAGLESYGDTQLFVSRGAGAWGPPVRVGAPSDITVVTLASKQA